MKRDKEQTHILEIRPISTASRTARRKTIHKRTLRLEQRQVTRADNEQALKRKKGPEAGLLVYSGPRNDSFKSE